MKEAARSWKHSKLLILSKRNYIWLIFELCSLTQSAQLGSTRLNSVHLGSPRFASGPSVDCICSVQLVSLKFNENIFYSQFLFRISKKGFYSYSRNADFAAKDK